MSFLFGSSAPKPPATVPEEPPYSQQELARKFGSPNTLVTYAGPSRILVTDTEGRTSTVPQEKLEELGARTARSIQSLYSTAFTPPAPKNSEESSGSGAAVNGKPAPGGKVVLRKIERKEPPTPSHTAEPPPAAPTSLLSKLPKLPKLIAVGGLAYILGQEAKGMLTARNATQDPSKVIPKADQTSVTGTPTTTSSAETPAKPPAQYLDKTADSSATNAGQEASKVIQKQVTEQTTSTSPLTTTSANVGQATGPSTTIIPEPKVGLTIDLIEANRLLEDGLNNSSVDVPSSTEPTTAVIKANADAVITPLPLNENVPSPTEPTTAVIKANADAVITPLPLNENVPPPTDSTTAMIKANVDAVTTPLPLNENVPPPTDSTTTMIKANVDAVTTPLPLNENVPPPTDPTTAMVNAKVDASPSPVVIEGSVKILEEALHPAVVDWEIGSVPNTFTTALSAAAEESAQVFEGGFDPAIASWELEHVAAATAAKEAAKNAVARSKFALFWIGTGLFAAAFVKKYADKKARQRTEAREAEIRRIEIANAANPPPNPLIPVPPPLGPIVWTPMPLRVLNSMINKFAGISPKISVPILLGLVVGGYYKRQAIEAMMTPPVQALVSMATENPLLGKALIPASLLITYGNPIVQFVEDLRSDFLPQFVENRVIPKLKAIVNAITPLPVTIAGVVTKTTATQVLNWYRVSTIALWTIAFQAYRHKTWVAKNKELLTSQLLPNMEFIQSVAKQHPVFAKSLLATTLAITYGSLVVDGLEYMRSTQFVQNRVRQLAPITQALVTSIPRQIKAAGKFTTSATSLILNHPRINVPALWVLASLGYQHKAWLAKNKTSLVNTPSPTLQAAVEIITVVPSFAKNHRVLTIGAFVTGILAWQVKKGIDSINNIGRGAPPDRRGDGGGGPPRRDGPPRDDAPARDGDGGAARRDGDGPPPGSTRLRLPPPRPAPEVTTTSLNTTTTPTTGTSSSGSRAPVDLASLSQEQLRCLQYILTTPGLLQGNSSSSSSSSATNTTISTTPATTATTTSSSSSSSSMTPSSSSFGSSIRNYFSSLASGGTNGGASSNTTTTTTTSAIAPARTGPDVDDVD